MKKRGKGLNGKTLGRCVQKAGGKALEDGAPHWGIRRMGPHWGLRRMGPSHRGLQRMGPSQPPPPPLNTLHNPSSRLTDGVGTAAPRGGLVDV